MVGIVCSHRCIRRPSRRHRARLRSAQDQQSQQRNQPGQFDFYVLALSWSPSFCKDTEERGRQSNEQCRGRPYSFVVHGLWPQYERGFPRDCQVPAPRLNRELMTSMLDLMPAPRLVYHEWDQHGTCSGLAAQAYFDLVRKAREAVKIPEAYAAPKATLTVAPDEVEEAFVKSQSRPVARGHRGHLRQHAAERGPRLHEQGSEIPRLRRDRPPRLPARQADHAAGARRLASAPALRRHGGACRQSLRRLRHRIVDRDKSALHVARGVVDGAMEIAQRTIEASRAMAIEAGIAVAVKQRRQQGRSSHPANLSDRGAVR